MNELCTKGATRLATMIRARQVTSSEVIDAYLARVADRVVVPAFRTDRSKSKHYDPFAKNEGANQ